MTGWRLFRRRCAAYVLDIALLFAVLGPTGWLVQRALGLAPTTGLEIWSALLLNFSLPAWLYFTVSDASTSGATLAKRLLGLRVSRQDGARVGALRALVRTGVKLLPWELTHISAFALATRLDTFSLMQGIGLATANMLAIVYLVCAASTEGRRSVHDFAAGTVVTVAPRD